MKVVLVLNWVGQKGAAHILRNHGWGGGIILSNFVVTGVYALKSRSKIFAPCSKRGGWGAKAV